MDSVKTESLGTEMSLGKSQKGYRIVKTSVLVEVGLHRGQVDILVIVAYCGYAVPACPYIWCHIYIECVISSLMIGCLLSIDIDCRSLCGTFEEYLYGF